MPATDRAESYRWYVRDNLRSGKVIRESPGLVDLDELVAVFSEELSASIARAAIRAGHDPGSLASSIRLVAVIEALHRWLCRTDDTSTIIFPLGGGEIFFIESHGKATHTNN